MLKITKSRTAGDWHSALTRRLLWFFVDGDLTWARLYFYVPVFLRHLRLGKKAPPAGNTHVFTSAFRRCNCKITYSVMRSSFLWLCEALDVSCGVCVCVCACMLIPSKPTWSIFCFCQRLHCYFYSVSVIPGPICLFYSCCAVLSFSFIAKMLFSSVVFYEWQKSLLLHIHGNVTLHVHILGRQCWGGDTHVAARPCSA